MYSNFFLKRSLFNMSYASNWSDVTRALTLLFVNMLVILQGIDAPRCRQPEHDARETYANTL